MDIYSEIDLIPTILFMVITSFTPGPNNILSTSMGVLYGYRKTLPFLFGITFGFLLIMLICAFLSTTLNKIFPSLAPVLRFIGAGYILWLAYSVYRSRNKIESSNETKPLHFKNGMLLQFLNPKAMFYGMTIFTTFLSPLLSNTLILITSFPFMLLITFSAVSTWALAGNLIRHWLDTPRSRNLFAIILALALVYTALDILEII